MTKALPPMASFSELVTTAVRASTTHLVEGSRRNAREALETRYALARQDHEIMAALPRRQPTVPSPRARRPA